MRWRLKSPASRLFAQPFVQAKIKENVKAPLHWRLWGKSTGDRWIHSQRASNTDKVSLDYVLVWHNAAAEHTRAATIDILIHGKYEVFMAVLPFEREKLLANGETFLLGLEPNNLVQ